jgi:Rrf2 family protein
VLRLSKKTDYALIALKDLASCPPGTSSSAREIAARYDIPVEFMAKVLQRLAKRGVLMSHQGTRGGYLLARPASKISVAEVIQAIDGPVMVTACSDVDETCDQYSKCNVRDPLWRLKDRIVQALRSFTIQELASDDVDVPFSLTFSRRPDTSASLSASTDH